MHELARTFDVGREDLGDPRFVRCPLEKALASHAAENAGAYAPLTHAPRKKTSPARPASDGFLESNLTVEYSLLWRGPERIVLPLCAELGIGFVCWSPLGVGFLTGAIGPNTRFTDADFRKSETRFAPENLPSNVALVDLLRDWALRKQATPAQLALAWLTAQHPWVVPIPGTTRMPHLLENLGATDVQFTPTELAELTAAASKVQIRGERLPPAVQVFSDVEAPTRPSP